MKKDLNHTIFGRLNHRLFHNAFTLWRKNMHIRSEKKKKFSMQVESETTEQELDRIEKKRTKLAQLKEKSAFKLDNLAEEQEYKFKMIKNQIARRIADRDANFIISKKEHIFQLWKQRSQRNAYVIKQLNKLMSKNFLQIGFNGIRSADQEKQKDDLRTKYLKRYSNIFVRNICSDAWVRWRKSMQSKNHQMKDNFKQESFHAQQNSNILRNKILSNRSLRDAFR